MLDLKNLEEKLDKALANETSESLTSWLQEKRLHTYLQLLGEGTFVNISHATSTVSKAQTIYLDNQFSKIPFLQDYPIAA